MIKNVTVYSKRLLKDYESLMFTLRYKKIRRVELAFLIFLIVYNFFVNQKSILFSLLYLLALMVIVELIFRGVSWNTFKKVNQKLFNHEVTYTFQQEQLHIHSAKTNTILRYAQIYQIIETEQAFYCFETKKDAYIVDKKGCSEEQWQQIKENLVQKRVNYSRKYTTFF